MCPLQWCIFARFIIIINKVFEGWQGGGGMTSTALWINIYDLLGLHNITQHYSFAPLVEILEEKNPHLWWVNIHVSWTPGLATQNKSKYNIKKLKEFVGTHVCLLRGAQYQLRRFSAHAHESSCLVVSGRTMPWVMTIWFVKGSPRMRCVLLCIRNIWMNWLPLKRNLS